MARKVFFSFHYEPDVTRAARIRSAGVLEGNQSVTDNGWESITKGGTPAIEAWIDKEMNGKSCVVVLIGRETAGRKWITREIVKGWDARKGVVGVNIHNLVDLNGKQSSKGGNPFDHVTMGGTSTKMSSVVMRYDPPYTASTDVYGYITKNIANWVEEAITIRNTY